MSIWCATGHRPGKLGGYGPACRHALESFAVAQLTFIAPGHVIVGMALGWDMAVGWACATLGVPFTAAVPFVGQELRWPADSRARYDKLLVRASKVIVTCCCGYSNVAMQIRNQWIVDNSEFVLALHDGSTGGTNNCLEYARKRGRPIVNVWNAWTSL